MGETNNNMKDQKAKLSGFVIILFVLAVMISITFGLLSFIITPQPIPLPFVFAFEPKLNPLILGELLATSFVLLPQTLGLLFAVIALYQIKGTGRLLAGRSFAITGLIISILAFPFPLWFFADGIAIYCKSQVIFINDASRGITIKLSNENKREFIDHIDIVITGNIEGLATVNAYKEMPTGENVESTFFDLDKPIYICPDVVQGRVKFEIWEEWYDEVCIFKYEPIDVCSGSLKVRYYLDASPYVTTD